MAYTDPGAVASSGTITSTWGNNVRASIQASAPAVVTTKGDLVAATATNTVARVAVGANDSTFVADSTQSTGVAWQIVPAAHVTKSDATTMETSAWTALEFDTETADTNAMHSTATNPSRMTIPTGGGGWYMFGFSGHVDDGSPNKWQVRFLLNGSTEIGRGGMSSYDYGALSVTALYPVSAADYIEVQYYSTGAHTISASPAFWAIWQRRL